MALRHDDYLQAFLIEGNIARFFSRESGHREPFYFYIQMLAAGFFPWSVFIPSALYLHFQNFRQRKDNVSFFLLLSAVAPLVFFSLSRSKLPTYITSHIPGAGNTGRPVWEAGLSTESGTAWARHLKNCIIAFFFFMLGVSVFAVFYIYIRHPGGQDQAKGKIFRVAHFGYMDTYDIVTAVAAVELTLKELGYAVELGRGVRAALEVLG